MMTEIKGAVLLLGCLMFFTLICAVATLGLVTRPGRWSERARPVS
jgi:hypothetical protein